MKKTSLIGIAAVAIVALGLLVAPTPALADTADFSFLGGTLTAVSGPGLSGSSTLIAVKHLPSGPIFISANLGTVAFTTGALTSGTISGGGTFGSGGSVTITANGTWGGISNGTVIYSGTFSGTTFWSGSGLTGPLSGAISLSVANLLFPGCGTGCTATNPGLFGLIITADSLPFSAFHPANIASGDVNTAVPEAGTLTLFGTGLLGIAGFIRRKLTT